MIAKGKGELVTYWLDVNSASSGAKSSRPSEADNVRVCTNIDFDLIDNNKTMALLLSEKTNRLIDWNVDVLRRMLQHIIARRPHTFVPWKQKGAENIKDLLAVTCTNPFEEVKEVIPLTQMKKLKPLHDESVVKISSNVLDQLRNYVSCIAAMYNNNEFHNFEHVSNVQLQRFCSIILFYFYTDG